MSIWSEAAPTDAFRPTFVSASSKLFDVTSKLRHRACSLGDQ